MSTTGLNSRNGSNGDLAPHPEFHHDSFPQSVVAARSGISDIGPPAGATPSVLSWAAGLITSTTLFGALYLILYQAAGEYYRHLGVSAAQAGVSQPALAGGVLEFALLYTAMLMPGTLLAVVLFRWITSARRTNAEMGVDAKMRIEMAVKSAQRTIVLLAVGGFMLLWLPPLIVHNLMAIILLGVVGCALGLGLAGPLGAVVYVGLVDRPRTLGLWGYFAAPIYLAHNALEWLRRQDSKSVLWARRRGPWAASATAAVLLALMLWGAADLAGGDVLRRGDSTRSILDVTPLGRFAPPLPVLDLLGVRPMPISPCLLDLGATSHLRAAVIVGHSGGRTYLVGVAGSGGFRHSPMGQVVRFSVADAELGVVNLDHRASPWDWDTSPRPVPAADTVSCS